MAEPQVDDKDDLDTREIHSFNKHWSWFGTVVQLANEDITKVEEITKYPLIFVLNFMAYEKDINEIRDRERKKMEQQLKFR